MADRLAQVLGAFAQACTAIYYWYRFQQMQESPTTTVKHQTKRLLGMPRNELLFGVMLMLIPVGISAAGIQPEFWLAGSIWISVILLAIHISWTSFKSNSFTRLLPGILVTAIISALIYKPLARQWNAEHAHIEGLIPKHTSDKAPETPPNRTHDSLPSPHNGVNPTPPQHTPKQSND